MELFKDEIVNQVRQSRNAYAARFNYDLDLIVKDLQKSGKARRGYKHAVTKQIKHKKSAV